MNEIDVYTPITIEGTEQGTGTPRVILARYPCSDDVMDVVDQFIYDPNLLVMVKSWYDNNQNTTYPLDPLDDDPNEQTKQLVKNPYRLFTIQIYDGPILQVLWHGS